MSARSLRKQIVNDLLTCVVCLDEYNNSKRRPLLLPCRHTVCAACVQSLIQSSNNKCPKDRKIFQVTNGLQGFDVDKITQDVQNFIRRSGILTINAIKDKFLKCLKCRADYDEAEHAPLSLPCQHPLCFSCVGSGSVHCPIDGRSCIVPLSGFPKNNTLRDLKDSLNSIINQQAYSRPMSVLSIKTNRITCTRQRQRTNQIRQTLWADNIRDFDLEESTTQLLPDTRPRGNYMVNFQSQPEYAQRVSPEPFYLPAINLHQVSQGQRANQIRQPLWADNIPDFDPEQSTTQFDFLPDIRPRGNYMVNFQSQPEYARRVSLQPFYFPAIPNNLIFNIPLHVSHNMTFNMGNVPLHVSSNMTFYNGNVIDQVGHNMNFNMGNIPFQASHNMTFNMESILSNIDQVVNSALGGANIDFLNIF